MSEPRERLLSREMIEAIDDLEGLQFLLEDVDEQAKHIEVDLEFRSDADLDWERRARGALAAHHICIGHLGRRIRALSPKREKIAGDGLAKIEAKARKHEAVAHRAVAERLVREQATERARIQRLQEAQTFARKTSWLAAFHQAASERLDSDEMSRLSGRAHRIVKSMTEAEIGELPAENSAQGSEPARDEGNLPPDEPPSSPKSDGLSPSEGAR